MYVFVCVCGGGEGGGNAKLVLNFTVSHFFVTCFASFSFGITIPDEALLTMAKPIDACSDLVDAEFLKDQAVLVQRGGCQFYEKIIRVQKAGAR